MTRQTTAQGTKRIAIVGSGPAGLMAATQLCSSKAHAFEVHIFESRPSAGRKLLIAGSSGLNITYDAPLDQFSDFYTSRQSEIKSALARFTPQDWLKFVGELGCETFLGTSQRYFVKEMKASNLLSRWVLALKEHGVTFQYGKEFSDLKANSLLFSDGSHFKFDAVVFALGGGSYQEPGSVKWPAIFKGLGVRVSKLTPSNVGFGVDWPKDFLAKNDRQPIKNVTLTTSRGSKQGDLLVTDYGLEGTPVYFVGVEGAAKLDLKPDLSRDEITAKLNASKEKRLPLREAKRSLKLTDTALDLLFHLGNAKEIKEANVFANLVKNFPLNLKSPRPIEEAISTSGGVSMDELSEDLELKKHPGLFFAGEMLDWDAPTGGFLIQASVSQGFVAAEGVMKRLA